MTSATWFGLVGLAAVLLVGGFLVGGSACLVAFTATAIVVRRRRRRSALQPAPGPLDLSVVTRLEPRFAPASPGHEQLLDAHTAGRLGQALRHAALQRSVEGLSRVVCDHALELVDGDRADCLFFDQSQQVLWRTNSAEELPLGGMAGEVVFHREARLVQQAGSGGAYAREIDDPKGIGGETLAMAPVLDGQHNVHAVLVLVRGAAPFSAEELALFQLYARRISIVFESVHLESILVQHMSSTVTSEADALFDAGALAAHRAGQFGEIVEFPPLLPPIAYVAASLALVGLLVVGGGARVNRYASGPALVVSPTAINVASPTQAILESVDVAAGERVTAGQPVAHLNADIERYDVQREEQEFEQRLVRRLASPADSALEAAVAEARVTLQRARARVQERVLTAPRDGVVDDIRLVAGQPIDAGQTVVSLGPVDGQLRLVCAIPANQLPALHIGQLLRFEPMGYTFSFQRVVVTSIGSRVLGPSELKAVFGREIGDTLEVKGPVVVVEAAMMGRSFLHDGVEYALHPGMLGTADIRVADDPALFVAMPFLKRVFNRHEPNGI